MRKCLWCKCLGSDTPQGCICTHECKPGSAALRDLKKLLEEMKDGDEHDYPRDS